MGILSIHNTNIENFSLYKKHVATGLRITDITPSPVEDASLSEKASELYESIVAKSSESNIEANFKAFLTNNLDVPTATAANKAMLADSLVAVKELIKDKFGDEKANEFMETVLTNTQTGFSETKLTSAIAAFFKKAATENYGTESFSEKISDITEFLNSDLSSYFDENPSSSESTKGLSYAINKFFNNNDTSSVKYFDESFAFIQYNGALSEANSTPSFEDSMFRIYAGSYEDSSSINISADMFEQIYNFLADDIQNETASAYFASYGNTDYLNAISGAFALIANDDGQEKAHAFQDFLNKNFSQKVTVDGKPLTLDWWSLGVDYANPDEIFRDTLTDRIRMSGIIDEAKEAQDVILNGHQTLTVSWIDKSSGVGTANAIDMDKLYDMITNATNQKNISSKTFVDIIV